MDSEILQFELQHVIQKLLAPLEKNPNSTDKSGTTPIHRAAKMDKQKLSKSLHL